MKKRLLALVLVIAMVFAMGITVFAAGTGSITINKTTAGNTYSLYKVFDATVSSDGTSIAYTYTKGKNTALDKALFGASTTFDLKSTGAPNVYNVYAKSSKSQYDISQFLKETVTSCCTPVKQITATSNTVVFSGVEQGYYIVLSKDSSGTVVITGLLTVTGDETIDAKEKVAVPKKVIVSPSGEVTEVSAFIGDTITYKLILEDTVNSYDGKKIKAYTAYDKLGDGMTNFKIVSVKVGDKTLSTSEYTYTAQSGTKPAEITIPWVDTSENFLYSEGTTICIECTAVVGENAFIGEASATEPSTNTNEGSFNKTYLDGSSDGDPTYVSTTVNVYAVSVFKSDSKGNPLSGAKFKLIDKDGKEVSFKAVAGEEGVYSYVPEGTTGAITEAITPANGKITIKGIKADTTTNWSLRETASPSGYNLLESDVVVSIADFESSSNTLTVYLDKDGNITEEGKHTTTKTITYTNSSASKNVVNNTGTELPETGGIGTTIFYIIGGIIVAGAIVFFVTRRRMDTKNKA